MVNSRTGAANIQNEPGVPENKEILKGKKPIVIGHAKGTQEPAKIIPNGQS